MAPFTVEVVVAKAVGCELTADTLPVCVEKRREKRADVDLGVWRDGRESLDAAQRRTQTEEEGT